jgi:hypothetical protein
MCNIIPLKTLAYQLQETMPSLAGPGFPARSNFRAPRDPALAVSRDECTIHTPCLESNA